MKHRKIILIFGRTGTGKTYLAKKLIKGLDRVIIIDKMMEYKDGIIFYNINDMIEYILKNEPEHFKMICRFESDEEIEKLFLIVWYLKNLTLVVEESEMYISPYSRNTWFLKLIRYGRHRNISIIAIARRVIELSNDVKANADKIITFKQILKRDLEYLEYLGFDKEKVANLNNYQFETIDY